MSRLDKAARQTWDTLFSIGCMYWKRCTKLERIDQVVGDLPDSISKRPPENDRFTQKRDRYLSINT